MLFNTLHFAVFLAVVLAAFYGLPWKRPILLAASYYFYMSWNPKFILLLGALTLIDFLAGRWIAASEGRARKLALLVSLSANLGFLAYFKYLNFLIDVFRLPTGHFDIILPIGISFHTFQSISYVVDVYRRQTRPVTNLLDYALFIAFFPQLVAGPIVRARIFFEELANWTRPTALQVQAGVLLVLFGLAKKMIVADNFAGIADQYFGNPGAAPGFLAAWGGVLAFTWQIFFDFSGYTDTAIGCAALFGFQFPENFQRPYLASSITEFWRRWHISLSQWLRDYLYISLGGNRRHTYRNLFLTMLLGGLWHGASWNFVIWGGYHGGLLAVERATRLRPSVAVTFVLVVIGWVFFRAYTLADSLYILQQMFQPSPGSFGWSPWLIRLAAATAVLAWCEQRWAWFHRLAKAPALAFAATCALLLLAIELFGVTEVSIPFVYFQF